MRKLVPGFILEKYQAGQLRGSLDAASLFVDLSGFSKMADALAQHGQYGAETLTEVMRFIFDPLVNSVYSQRGFVVGYAGDSFTAIFPEEQATGPAMRRSLAAALEMHEHVRAFQEIKTPYGNFPISIKVGLGYGVATWQIFTSADRKKATFCMRGESVRSAVIAEECASPGMIVVHESVYHAVKDIIDALPVGDCFQIASIKPDLPDPRLSPDPEPDPAIIRIFVPDEVLRLPIVGEFRQVVNVFIDIPEGISDEALMAPFMESVYALQVRYGGFFLRPDFGDKGFNLLMFWGAPIAYETDIVRAINFVLELVANTRLDYRVGITYRTAYSGFMGARLREDYTAYGWSLNLAARLMEHAGKNEIWLDEEIARRAEKYFDVKLRGEFKLKGFEHAQKAFVLTGRKDVSETVYAGDLVGRRAELEILDLFVEPLWEGKFAGVMVVQGEAGIGKSRLVHTFQTSARSAVQWAVCQSDEILRQSFNPFKNWMEKRFGYQDGLGNEINLNSLTTRLQKLIDDTPDPNLAAELTRTSSVLAALLNLTQENSLYQQLDAKGRYENTLIALSALLRAESLQKPLILFIEDLHWLDDDTRAFLSYLVRSVLADPNKNYPLAIIGTQRPEATPLEFDNETYRFHVKLGALTPSDLLQVALNMLGHPVHMELLELLFQRSDGNPFFAEQLLHLLVDNDLLILGEDGFFETKSDTANALPTDVNALLIARLDSLTADVRETVQTAAVLGREFEVRLLAEMLHGDLNISEKVNEAERHGIWFALDEIQYIFRHALLRDAAYSMQMEARRRQLHEIALLALETVYAADLTGHYGELAYHAERANVVDKALDYLVKAGKAASASFQNNQAADYYTSALAFVFDDDLRTRFDLIYERAIIYQNTGNRTLQLKDIDTLEQLASRLQDPEKTFRVMYLRSHYLFTTGDLVGTLEIANQTIDMAAKVSDDKATLDAYAFIIGPLMRMGNHEEAMQRAIDGLIFARRASNPAIECRLLIGKGLVAIEQNRFALARDCFQDALEISRELKDKYLESSALNNIANCMVAMKGDFSSAWEYYEQAYAIDHERGDRYKEGIALGNLGWLAGLCGDFSVARKYQEQALVIAREVNNLYQEVYMLVNLSGLLGTMGDPELALKYAKDGHTICQKIHDRSGEGWAYLNMGHAYLLMDDLTEARKAYEHCRSIREELKQPNLAVEALAGLVQTALRTGDIILAGQLSEKIFFRMEIDPTFAGVDDPLRIYYACYRAFENIQDPRSRLVLQNALQLLDAQVSRLREEGRRMYVESVPWRQALIDAGGIPKPSSE
jgi:class 3 adenylate cyclase/tetratricopeptide (TPR) repeat protein